MFTITLDTTIFCMTKLRLVIFLKTNETPVIFFNDVVVNIHVGNIFTPVWKMRFITNNTQRWSVHVFIITVIFIRLSHSISFVIITVTFTIITSLHPCAYLLTVGREITIRTFFFRTTDCQTSFPGFKLFFKRCHSFIKFPFRFTKL